MLQYCILGKMLAEWSKIHGKGLNLNFCEDRVIVKVGQLPTSGFVPMSDSVAVPYFFCFLLVACLPEFKQRQFCLFC